MVDRHIVVGTVPGFARAALGQAVEAMWPGLKVVKVNTLRMPGKARTVRTRKGVIYKEARPWKKAIVTLASGQSIPDLQA